MACERAEHEQDGKLEHQTARYAGDGAHVALRAREQQHIARRQPEVAHAGHEQAAHGQRPGIEEGLVERHAEARRAEGRQQRQHEAQHAVGALERTRSRRERRRA